MDLWKGDCVLNNVTLNPEIVDLLQIPVHINYSSLGKVQLIAPWKNISTQPVQLIIDHLFLIIKPIKKEN